MITQTLQLFIAAYRELNARKLFWITMGLNLLVVALFASLGINRTGVTLLHWQFENDFFNSRLVSPELFYKVQFVSWGIPYWLSWIATILALISTAGMIPDLVTSGSIDTLLSKPIGRVRLFLTKYLAALLFVALQVLVFCTGCFLVFWIRGKSIEPSVFMAVPIVLVFYSYLFAMCALIGMVTRSTIASLMLTILFWFAVFIVNVGDSLVLTQREGVAVRVEDTERNLQQQREFAQASLDRMEQSGELVLDADDNEVTDPEQRLRTVNPFIEQTENRLEESRKSLGSWSRWTARVMVVKTILPKTQETIGLLSRYMINEDEIQRLMAERMGQEPPEDVEQMPAMADPRAAERAELAMRDRSVSWILGTSLLYEGVILGLCCLIFRRRDF